MADTTMPDQEPTDTAPADTEGVASTATPESATTPRQSLSRDEAMLQEAGDATEHNEASAPPTKTPKPKKSKKKLLIILLIILLLAGGGFGAWKVLSAKKSNANKQGSAKSSSATSSGQTGANENNSHIPNTLAYAYKPTDKDPYTIYYRPAAGGDRKEAITLGKNVIPTSYDVRGSNVAFATDEGIYISSDAGKTYKKAVSLSLGQQVTSLKFSTSGQHVAYGYLAATGGKNVVKKVDLSGQGSIDLFTSDKAGVFIYAWNEDKNQLAYGEGCYSCDGGPSDFSLRDLKANSSKKLIGDVAKTDTVQYNVRVSDDMSKAVYVVAGPDDHNMGLSSGAAPYKVISYDNAAAKATTLITLGMKDEKNANGTYKYRKVMVGFVSGTNKPYYADENTLHAYMTENASTLYQADKPILSVAYVSAGMVVAGAGTDTSDYTLASYSVADKKATTIFMGDNNTIIFGVTEK